MFTPYHVCKRRDGETVPVTVLSCPERREAEAAATRYRERESEPGVTYIVRHSEEVEAANNRRK